MSADNDGDDDKVGNVEGDNVVGEADKTHQRNNDGLKHDAIRHTAPKSD